MKIIITQTKQIQSPFCDKNGNFLYVKMKGDTIWGYLLGSSRMLYRSTVHSRMHGIVLEDKSVSLEVSCDMNKAKHAYRYAIKNRANHE